MFRRLCKYSMPESGHEMLWKRRREGKRNTGSAIPAATRTRGSGRTGRQGGGPFVLSQPPDNRSAHLIDDAVIEAAVRRRNRVVDEHPHGPGMHCPFTFLHDLAAAGDGNGNNGRTRLQSHDKAALL